MMSQPIELITQTHLLRLPISASIIQKYFPWNDWRMISPLLNVMRELNETAVFNSAASRF